MKEELVNGIILAGGQSSRMGADKGVLTLNGRKMVEHIIAALRPLARDIFIIANNDHYNDLRLPVFPDEVSSRGPLAGIYTGLLHSNAELNIILSCDVPMVNTAFLQYLLERSAGADITVPERGGRTEQLIGVYRRTCLAVARDRICLDHWSVKALQASGLKVCKVPVIPSVPGYSEKLLCNVNTPEELKAIAHETAH